MYSAILRAAAVLAIFLSGATPVLASAYVIVDSPKPHATVSSSFVVGGWAIDVAATTDSGVSELHVWAYPVTGASPVFLGGISRVARPDVAAQFGSQFGQSGFSVAARGLAAGKYTLAVFPFSSVRKAFDYQAAVAVPVTVTEPVPSLVVVDFPRPNATVPQSFAVGGWAIDLAARFDSGISQLHVWAYPATGAAPLFIGEIARSARPDVAEQFGSQFGQAGFNIAIRDIAVGKYTFVISPYSAIRNQFDHNAAVALALNVVPPAPAPVPTSSGKELRVLQWNIRHGGFGTDNVYSTDRVATWVAQMNPDVVIFNEIEKNTYWGREDQPEIYKTLLQRKTGRTWYYVFAQEYGDWSSNGKGNIIYSTYPIDTSDRYELMRNYDRSIAMASITVNGQLITLINTHLDPYDQALRLAQATEVTTWSSAQPENRILAGDMNAWPNQTSIAHFNETYYDSWTVAANQGTATAFSGNDGQTKNGRIDYIFYSKNSRNLSVKSSQVYDTRDANGAMPSDHRPVLTTFIVR